jgi:hypothetical protein
MTDDRVPLSELSQKVGSGEFLRAVACTDRALDVEIEERRL